MAFRLDGRVAIVTGGGRGNGKAIARVFARQGATVLVVDRHADVAQQVADGITAEGGTASTFIGDVSSEADMQAMAQAALDRYGKLDIVVANAGIFPPALIEDLKSEVWDQVLAVNSKSVFLAVKACAPAMKQQRYGRIVATSSITGTRVGSPMMSHYSASKAAIDGFILSAALELAPYGITINSVRPGNVRTEGVFTISTEAEVQLREQAIPLKRFANPEEVGYAALFFASEEARYVTGQSLILDGGQTLPEFPDTV